MTWTLKPRPAAAGPVLAEYECPVHGRFEALIDRTANGDAPDEIPCPAPPEGCAVCGAADGDRCHAWCKGSDAICGLAASWRISAPALKRDSVPCYATVRGGDTERRPGMLDTRPLAEGMPTREWKAKQRAAREERRHHQLIKRGLKTRRVQV